MTLALVTEPQKYFLNTDTYFKIKFAIRCKPGYRFRLGEGGKSGQHRAMHQ
jgi:hypothetical protein